MQIEIPKEILPSTGDPVHGIEKRELMMTLIQAAQMAWDDAIKPKLENIRVAQTDTSKMKKGYDFFTEADTASESAIKEALKQKFGSDAFRFFGEENGYDGNPDANITIRIDPIDGTELFKFGSPDWSIMIGAYTGRNNTERQFLSVTYFPEYYRELILRIGDDGVYKLNVDSGVVTKFEPALPRDVISDVMLLVHKNHEISKRGDIEQVFSQIEQSGGRVRSGSPAHTKQALETRGGRAFIIQNDWGAHDFILYSALVSLGYKLFSFDGTELNVDDPNVADSKFMLLPPGRAAKMLREIISKTLNI